MSKKAKQPLTRYELLIMLGMQTVLLTILIVVIAMWPEKKSFLISLALAGLGCTLMLFQEAWARRLGK